MEDKDLSQIIQDLTKSVNQLMNESIDIGKFIEVSLKEGVPYEYVIGKIGRILAIHKDLKPVFEFVQELSPHVTEMMSLYREVAILEPFIKNMHAEDKKKDYKNGK